MFFCRRRPTASECLEHPWLNSKIPISTIPLSYEINLQIEAEEDTCDTITNNTVENIKSNHTTTVNGYSYAEEKVQPLTPVSQRKSATCLSCAQCGATCCHSTHNVTKSVITVDRGILC